MKTTSLWACMKQLRHIAFLYLIGLIAMSHLHMCRQAYGSDRTSKTISCARADKMWHSDPWGRANIEIETSDSVLARDDKAHVDSKDLALRVVFEDRVYLLGEPMLVHCLLVNETEKSITIPYQIPVGNEEGIKFAIRDSNGGIIRRASEVNACYYRGPQSITIPPQYHFVRTINLSRDFAITEPGEYVVSVEYKSSGEFYDANALKNKQLITKSAWAGSLRDTLGTIKVRAPANRIDREAMETLLRGLSAYNPRERFAILLSGENEESLIRVIADYPQSKYSGYARFALIENLLADRRWRERDRAQQALKMIQEIPDLDYPLFFRERLRHRTILTSLGAGNAVSEVAPLVGSFRKEFPGSPYPLPEEAEMNEQ